MQTLTADSIPLSGQPGLAPLAAVIVASPDAHAIGRSLPLDGAALSLGRSEDAVVCIDDHRLSRQHAILRSGRGGRPPALADLGSRNGSFVDGRRIQGAELTRGTVLRLGDTCLVIDISVPSPQPASSSVLRGSSALMVALRSQIARVAPTQLTVLITGETGTGKELVAGEVHRLSGRAGRLVPVNCGAIPEHLVESTLFGHRRGAFTGATESSPGVFVQADGGTLFLDEIGELPLPAQTRLLRVLEDLIITPVGGRRGRQVDVRVVAATHIDLREAVRQGRFRADLFARLEEWPVHPPPLRDRRSEICELARVFLDEQRHPPVLGPDAVEALLLYDWPFNVRELRKLCKRLAIASTPRGTIELSDLPPAIVARITSRRAAVAVSEPAPSSDREAIEQALAQTSGSVTRAARILNMSRRTLYRRLSELEIDPAKHR